MNEQKIARICWNDNGWQKPSGMDRKSKQGSYEAQHHFGHEEWLFDHRLIDGYKYAHLTPLMAQSHKGKIYDIHLYTRNGDTNQNLYVGVIKNAYCLKDEETEDIIKKYKELGYRKEQIEELSAVNADVDYFKKSTLRDAFNVRFRPEDVIYLGTSELKELDDSVLGQGHRYNLQNLVGKIKFKKPSKQEGKWRNESDYVMNLSAHRVEVKSIHKKMQNALKHYLLNVSKEYMNVELEIDHIDLVAKTKKGTYHYYELKTANEARKCIREALGQILEYCNYDCTEKAEKMFIVGPAPMSASDKNYIEYLRKQYKLPIWYLYFNMENNCIE